MNATRTRGVVHDSEVDLRPDFLAWGNCCYTRSSSDYAFRYCHTPHLDVLSSLLGAERETLLYCTPIIEAEKLIEFKEGEHIR